MITGALSFFVLAGAITAVVAAMGKCPMSVPVLITYVVLILMVFGK